MALSLAAEQKCILDLFSDDKIYVIPPYQRAYAWEMDQCQQLYLDLKDAFEENKEYFLGNLVLAKSNQPKYVKRVVDGQQRLTTLWLLLKSLSVMYPTINPLQTALSIKNREGEGTMIKVLSESRENKDHDVLESILKMDANGLQNLVDISACSKHTLDKISLAIAYLYGALNYYRFNKGEEKARLFVDFILDNVYLLPIELYDDDMAKAEERALTIFETLNNRGKGLEDADIFKAHIYKRALSVGKQEEFSLSWKSFREQCENMKIPVDEVFRYYSHIIRGRNRIVTMERNLRYFFLQEKFSPILTLPYDEIMRNLFSILHVIEFIKKEQNDTKSLDGLYKWIGLLKSYSNTYPLIALVVYLYENGTSAREQIINFIQIVVRYSYSMGATRSIKFEIYNIIECVCQHRVVSDHRVMNGHAIIIDNPGRMKNLLVMLYYYLQPGSDAPYASIDRLVNDEDFASFALDLPVAERTQLLESVGNYIVVDTPKENGLFAERRTIYKYSENRELKDIASRYEYITPEIIRNRQSIMQKELDSFFC